MRVFYPIRLDREGYSISTIHRNVAKELGGRVQVVAFREGGFSAQGVRLFRSFKNRYLDAVWINLVSLFLLPFVDVVHMVPNIALLPMFLLAKLLGKKTVYTFHETLDETKKRNVVERSILMLFGRWSCKRTCVSDYVGASAERRGIFAVTVYNGLEESLFVRRVDKESIRSEFLIGDKRPIALYVGAFRKGKGVDVVLELARKNEKINFIVIGSGELYDGVKANLSLSNVFYKPFYAHDRLNVLYSSVDAVLFPSTIDAFGLVCVEAISCGTPVLAFDVGGAREIVMSGTGLLCKDVSEMNGALKRVVSGKFMFSAKSAEKVRKRFNWEKIAQEYLKVYES